MDNISNLYVIMKLEYFQDPLEETDDTPVVITIEEVGDVIKSLEVGDTDSDQVLVRSQGHKHRCYSLLFVS